MRDVSTKVLNLDSAANRELKRKSLAVLLATTPGGEASLRASGSYLDAAKNVPPERFSAACWAIRDSWTNEFTSPQPGHIMSMVKTHERAAKAAARAADIEREMQKRCEYRRVSMAKRIESGDLQPLGTVVGVLLGEGGG